MLVLDKRCDLRSVGFFKEVERHHLQGLHDPADNKLRFFLAKRAHQHLAGSVHATLRDELLRDAQLMELFNDAFPEMGIDFAHPGDFNATMSISSGVMC